MLHPPYLSHADAQSWVSPRDAVIHKYKNWLPYFEAIGYPKTGYSCTRFLPCQHEKSTSFVHFLLPFYIFSPFVCKYICTFLYLCDVFGTLSVFFGLHGVPAKKQEGVILSLSFNLKSGKLVLAGRANINAHLVYLIDFSIAIGIYQSSYTTWGYCYSFVPKGFFQSLS